MTTTTTLGTERIEVALSSDATGGGLAVFAVTVPPGGGPPMLHRHEAFELYRVRSGELAFYIEGRGGAVARSVAGPGAVVPIAGGLEHTIRNESGAPAEALVVFSPGAAMERFARTGEPDGIEMTRTVEEGLAEAGRRTPYLTLAHFAGDGDDLLRRYRQTAEVMAGVGRDHGLLAHAGATTDDGFLVVNLWPARECAEAAGRDPRRAAALRRAAISPDRIRREHHDVAEVVVP
jgi:mannose-6-phosphate isomerase-like protein (cupin superfamily)